MALTPFFLLRLQDLVQQHDWGRVGEPKNRSRRGRTCGHYLAPVFSSAPLLPSLAAGLGLWPVFQQDLLPRDGQLLKAVSARA